MKVRMKNDILLWLAKGDNKTLSVEKAHKAFVKDTKIACELRLFKTYHGKYNAGEVEPKVVASTVITQADIDSIELTTFRAGERKLPTGVFIPYKTGHGIDRLFSQTRTGGGPMKGTVTVASGGPGVGKSTLVYHMQAMLQGNYPKDEITCLQSEMRDLDLEWELSEENEGRKPWMAVPNFVLLSEAIRPKGVYRPELTKAVITKVFQHGYDVLFIDSFEDIVQKLKAFGNMSESMAESFLLNLIEATCSGKNDRGVLTAVIAIQQETKGGLFKGSNKLKHAITGMLHMRKDKKGDRYVMFSKNRRGGGNVDKAMFFGLDKKGDLVYDVAAFEAAENLAESLRREKERLGEKTANFNELFAKTPGEDKIAETGKLGEDGKVLAKKSTKRVKKVAVLETDENE